MIDKDEHFRRGVEGGREDIEKWGIEFTKRVAEGFTYTADDEADGGIAYARGYTLAIRSHIIANKD